MWNRAELKARGKAAFQANYWRCVLVALILVALIGGGSASGRSSGHSDNTDDVGIYADGTIRFGDTTIHYNTPEQFAEAAREFAKEFRPALPVFSAVAGIFGLLALLVKIFLVNPLEVGCSQFFLRNSERPAELDELWRSFRPEWMNNVVSLLLRDVFVALWSLLLVIPGIIKVYSYRMTPYIQAEHPEMSGTEAITLSKQMMNGHKWNAFVFDLSFIGWYLLDVITVGLVGVFYVHPYKAASDAELYRAISAGYFNSGATLSGPEF